MAKHHLVRKWICTFVLIQLSTCAQAVPFNRLLNKTEYEQQQIILQAQTSLIGSVRNAKSALASSAKLVQYPDIHVLTDLAEQYKQLELARLNQMDAMRPLDHVHIEQQRSAYQKDFFLAIKGYRWPSQIQEYQDFAQLLFSFMPEEEQAANKEMFQQSLDAIEHWQTQLSDSLLEIEPGFSQISPLVPILKPNPIHIVVFDVFSKQQLDKQRAYFTQARIDPIQTFGDPVSLTHGNAVIDTILQLSPDARITPIQADAQSYLPAFNAIALINPDMINMSRAFPENNGHLDLDAWNAIAKVAEKSILIKSMGNCGTDLDGQLSPIRVENDLGPIGAISCYDTSLIQEVVTAHWKPGLLIRFAINGQYANERVALSATIPGSNEIAQHNSIKVPAEAVYSPSSGLFESGSSFAAPQLSATLAELLKRFPEENGSVDMRNKSCVLESVSQTAVRQHQMFEEGRGLLNAQAAAIDLAHRSCVKQN